MPQVTGLAASMDVGLENVAMSLAFLTKGGYSARQSATFLKAMMTSLLAPTGKLKVAIEELGYESGEQLLKSEGMLGAYSELYTHLDGSFAGVITNTEALQGAMALMSDSSRDFFGAYREGLDGATAAGEAIQTQSNQWERLDSKMKELKITIGNSLAPTIAMSLLDEQIIPGINAVIAFWVQGDNASNSLKALGIIAGAISFAKLIAGLKAILAALVAIKAAALAAAARPRRWACWAGSRSAGR